MVSSQKVMVLLYLKEFHNSNTTKLYILQSHSICKQLKATDFFCILGHKQLESRQWNDGKVGTVKVSFLPLFSLRD